MSTSIIPHSDIARIRALAAELDTLGQTALEKAIEAGNLLRQCKARLAHGEWMDWLAGNFTFTDRTARRWMGLSKDVEIGKLKTDTVSNLTDAYRIASKPKETNPTKEDKTESGPRDSFSEMSDTGKAACHLWWDYCAAEVLARWAMGLDAESIARQTGRPLDEVRRIIRPQPVPWRSYGTEIKIPVEEYNSARTHTICVLMDIALMKAVHRLGELKDSDKKTKGLHKLAARAELYEEERRETHCFTPLGIMDRDDSPKDKRANERFTRALNIVALSDARHACGVEPFPELNTYLLDLQVLETISTLEADTP